MSTVQSRIQFSVHNIITISMEWHANWKLLLDIWTTWHAINQIDYLIEMASHVCANEWDCIECVCVLFLLTLQMFCILEKSIYRIMIFFNGIFYRHRVSMRSRLIGFTRSPIMKCVHCILKATSVEVENGTCTTTATRQPHKPYLRVFHLFYFIFFFPHFEITAACLPAADCHLLWFDFGMCTVSLPQIP